MGQEPVRNVGMRKQLFIDDRFVDSSADVSWEVHTPKEDGVVLRAEKQWEGHRVGTYGTVIQDGDVYRMYYQAVPPIEDTDHCNCMTCVAESGA